MKVRAGYITEGNQQLPVDPVARWKYDVKERLACIERAKVLEAELDKDLAKLAKYSRGWWKTLEKISECRTEQIRLKRAN